MPVDLIIRGGSVVREDRVQRADLAIDNGKIVEIAEALRGAAREELDASGLHIFPGVVDPHVHFNEPGRTEWEGFATGSSALAAGGGTLFFDMPLNSSPPVLDGPSFDLKLDTAKRSSYTDFALWGGLTPNNLDKLEELAARGVVGFKAFMCDSGIDDFPMVDDYTLWRGMQLAARLGLPVAVHAENNALVSALAEAAPDTSFGSFMRSRPIVAEVEAIRRAITFAQATGCSLHIVHVSSTAGSAEAYEGKHLCSGFDFQSRVAADVTCETCPHYLLLDEMSAMQIGAAAKCAPPLRSADERFPLLCQLTSGGIDFVASDHSPAPASVKSDPDFFKVWGGIAGVQSTLAIMLSLEPALALETVGLMTATNAARRFKIPSKGGLAPGFDADVTLVDLNRTFELRREDLLDRHKLSPYIGRKFRGVVRRTILRGRTIFLDGQMVGHPVGRLVVPQD